jgi:hypothetical protein
MDTAIIMLQRSHRIKLNRVQHTDRQANAEIVKLLLHFIESSYTVAVPHHLLVNK